MKAASFFLFILSLLVLGACGAGDGTICDEASRHVAACLGSAPRGGGQCDGRNADQAAELLALDCNSLGAYLSSGGKADGSSYSYSYNMGDVSCDGSDGTTSCDDLCKSIEVEFSVFGMELDACYKSSCDPSYGEGLGRCQCKYKPCLFGGTPLDNGAADEPPATGDEPAGEPPADGDEPYPSDEP